MELQKKVALVTGATRGIGKAIALKLFKEGADVVVNGTKMEQDFYQNFTVIKSKKNEIIGIRADVTQIKEVEKMTREIIQRFGKIDILINNAGVVKDSLLIRMKEEDWDVVINTNLKGTFNCTKIISKYMIKQNTGGKIVNISSIIGITGNIGQANYAASKAGIIGLTKTVAKELAPKKINVNAIAPGFINTDMTRQLPEKIRINLQERIPLKRLGTVEDIAQVAYFLVSEAASYITGQVIIVDGGIAI